MPSFILYHQGHVQKNPHFPVIKYNWLGQRQGPGLLAKGLPIASGVVESACNSLINTRMEGAGMFWSVDGAEAMLKLRGVFLDDLWDEFHAFRINREKKKLYGKYDNIKANTIENVKRKKAA